MSAARAAQVTVSGSFAARAAAHPERPAIEERGVTVSYGELLDRALRSAGALRARGVGAGDRVAVLSENRTEYLETILAAGFLGAIVACQNQRLAGPELAHCLALVGPKIVLGSERFRRPLDWPVVTWDAHAAERAAAAPIAPVEVDPEAPLLVLYTSGTTGLPKGAVISHRAEVVRNLVVRAEYHLSPTDTYVAWSPMYHMGGTEYSLGALMSGGKVIVVDGFDPDALVDIVGREKLGWLLLMPGMVGRLADLLEARGVRPVGVRMCGVMADLVPRADLARITRLLGAPYANTFGATETGNPPASAGFVPIGEAPERLPKTPSVFCEYRLVDPDGRDVPLGAPGELWMRGPTLFSGYWDAPEATAEAFRDGWFHMGDVFVRNADGTIEFVDRVKYLIKSGGENIYPAEIERVLLADPRIAEAAVVRRPDPTWGEVPVAFVARRDPALTEADVLAACDGQLARYKRPKAVHFLAFEEFPRSASGKIQRHLLEERA